MQHPQAFSILEKSSLRREVCRGPDNPFGALIPYGKGGSKLGRVLTNAGRGAVPEQATVRDNN